MSNEDWFKIDTKGWLHGTVRQLTPLQRCIWVDLLALSKEGRFPGWIASGWESEHGKSPLLGYSVRKLADKLGLNHQALQQALDEFKNRSMVEITPKKAIKVLNWNKYQSIPAHKVDESLGANHPESGANHPQVDDGSGANHPEQNVPKSPEQADSEQVIETENQESKTTDKTNKKTTNRPARLEEWDEDITDEDGTICSADIRRAIAYIRSPDGEGLTEWRKRLSVNYVRKNARRLVDFIPEKWGEPNGAKKTKNKGCEKCAHLGWGPDGKSCPYCDESSVESLPPHEPPVRRFGLPQFKIQTSPEPKEAASATRTGRYPPKPTPSATSGPTSGGSPSSERTSTSGDSAPVAQIERP